MTQENQVENKIKEGETPFVGKAVGAMALASLNGFMLGSTAELIVYKANNLAQSFHNMGVGNMDEFSSGLNVAATASIVLGTALSSAMVRELYPELIKPSPQSMRNFFKAAALAVTLGGAIVGYNAHIAKNDNEYKQLHNNMTHVSAAAAL